MRAETLFIAERPAAQHCAALIGRSREPRDAIAMLQPLADRFARQLGPALGTFCGGQVPVVSTNPLKIVAADQHCESQPALSGHCVLVTGTPDIPILITIDGAALLRMVDRTFGGRGEVGSPLPERLPPSASLLISRVAALLADRLSIAAGSEGAVLAQRHGTDIAELSPFSSPSDVVVIRYNVAEPEQADWWLDLAVPASAATSLGFDPAVRGPGQGKDRLRHPEHEPVGAIPLPLTATLVDTRLPLSTIAGLAPGTVLPVAIARQVPLRIGTRTIATGTVGSMDDCVALQITAIC